MHNSLFNVLLRLPPSTMAYAGHDYGDVPCRTLGEERLNNPLLSARDLRSFVSISD